MIVEASSAVHDLGLMRPYAVAGRAVNSVQNVLVRLSDGKHDGLGAAAPSPAVTGETIETCAAAAVAVVEGCLLGSDIRLALGCLNSPPARELLRGAPAAAAAVEMAVLDLMSRRLELPLARLLGLCHSRMPTSVTIGILPVEEALEEASRLLSQGFRILKIKIGADVVEDIELLFRLREHVGSAIAIRVDANQGYSPGEFARFLSSTAPLDLELIEQPLPRGKWSALSRSSTPPGVPLAADEDLHGVADAIGLASGRSPYSVFNIKLMKCGGVLSARVISQIAMERGVDLMWGCMDESCISIAAAMHAAFSCQNTRFLDLDGSFDLASDLACGGFRLDGGALVLSDEPGLGVSLVERVR